MLDESICHVRGFRSVLSLYSFLWKFLVANNVGRDQTPHYVASDLGLLSLPMTLLQVSRSEWVKLLVFTVMLRQLCLTKQ